MLTSITRGEGSEVHIDEAFNSAETMGAKDADINHQGKRVVKSTIKKVSGVVIDYQERVSQGEKIRSRGGSDQQKEVSPPRGLVQSV